MPDDRMDGEEDDRLAALEERVETMETAFDNKLADVRDRVVQVKRETDEKAETDHDHEDVLDRLEELEALLDERDTTETVDRLETTLENHSESIDAIENKIDTLAASMVEAQDDIESIAGLQDDVDEVNRSIESVNEEVELLATSLLEVQDRLGELNHIEAKRDALGELLERAAEADIQRATCEECDSEVEIGFLMEPACPGCDATFVDVEAGGILRSAVLRTGTMSVDEAVGAEADATAAEKSEFLGGDGEAQGGDQGTPSVPDAAENDDEEDDNRDEAGSFDFGAGAEEPDTDSDAA